MNCINEVTLRYVDAATSIPRRITIADTQASAFLDRSILDHTKGHASTAKGVVSCVSRDQCSLTAV